ncbi:hypothetical protein ABVT39_012410 [Epinephelus coioides]
MLLCWSSLRLQHARTYFAASVAQTLFSLSRCCISVWSESESNSWSLHLSFVWCLHMVFQCSRKCCSVSVRLCVQPVITESASFSVSDQSRRSHSWPSCSVCSGSNSAEVCYEFVFSVLQQSDSAESLFSSQFEVTANSSGEYVCKRTVVYPPPCIEDCHTTEVIVAEKQSLPIINDTVPGTNQSCPVRTPFIPEVVTWVACGGLFIYSLSITCVTIALWVKMKRNEEDSNVYINTKPGEARKPYKA